ncbi:MAG TPA: hypothetical protein VHX63_00700 [Acidobacteriaceae bacterium]|nr:hypothetical protein [Acidobacteriaceae bacterium]
MSAFLGVKMLNGYDNVVLILACLISSFTFLFLLNRIWIPAKRRAHNDVIGWQISVIGTIYAVMIGFMLYAVWGNFQVADSNADLEASALVNVYRTAEGLPEPQRDAVQQWARMYARDMVTAEWPAMSRGHWSREGHQVIDHLWSVVISTQVNNASQQTSLDHTIFELGDLTLHRRQRRLENDSSLPAILWAVLISGGIITIVAASLIGSENIVLHFVLVLSLALLISLILSAIADIDMPFRGSVHVSSYAFAQAQNTMSGND